jgi:hypothetical protein
VPTSLSVACIGEKEKLVTAGPVEATGLTRKGAQAICVSPTQLLQPNKMLSYTDQSGSLWPLESTVPEDLSSRHLCVVGLASCLESGLVDSFPADAQGTWGRDPGPVPEVINWQFKVSHTKVWVQPPGGFFW